MFTVSWLHSFSLKNKKCRYQWSTLLRKACHSAKYLQIKNLRLGLFFSLLKHWNVANFYIESITLVFFVQADIIWPETSKNSGKMKKKFCVFQGIPHLIQRFSNNSEKNHQDVWLSHFSKKNFVAPKDG